MKKFKTLFVVKVSLISLYLALTFPITFISINELKLFSIIFFLLGLFFIVNLTNDYVEVSESRISYKISFFSKIFGKKSWEIFWKNIRSIKSLPTSQGSKVFYFTTKENKNFLVPQRIENFDEFIAITSAKTGFDLEKLSYISPLWTYKLLTYLSSLMLIGELVAFFN